MYTHYAATALFFVFGIRLLWDVIRGTVEPEGDISEVEKELELVRRGKKEGDGGGTGG